MCHKVIDKWSLHLFTFLRMATILLRVAFPCVLILAALCTFAGPKDKEPAPRFNATTTTGEKFTNQSIKGKVVLLEFWTTWCGFCTDEAAFVDKIGHARADKGLILLAIDERKADRKSTRLNSSHSQISYAVFCLKKKKLHNISTT